MAFVMQALCHLTSADQLLRFWCRRASDLYRTRLRVPVNHQFAEEPGNLSALDLPGLCGHWGLV